MNRLPATIDVDLRHVIVMIARALDFVGIDDHNHGHRVGYIAGECARRLGWPADRREFVFLAGLLHDCGVSSTTEHLGLLEGMEPEDVTDHCLRGQRYLNDCRLLAPFAEVVRQHHTRWDTLKDLDLPREDKETAALILMADRVDVLRAAHLDVSHPDTIVLHGGQIAASLEEYSGGLFCPEFVDVMKELVTVDGFWFTMDQSVIEDQVMAFDQDEAYDQPLDSVEVASLAYFMSRIVDAKSAFTHQHSERVAVVARELAADLGLSSDDQEQIHIAGLLHDIGKLRVPDQTLHHPGPLTAEQYSEVKRHVVDTKLALKRCFPSSSIPDWASNHHEKLDGTGYPYKLTGEQLDLPSRIIAVADIFQALVQERPYRGRLSFAEVDLIMGPMVRAGKLDATVYGRIESRPGHYYETARGAETA